MAGMALGMVTPGGAAKGLAGLSRAAQFGVRPYGQLRVALRGTGLQAHHLIERRFAQAMGQRSRDMLAVSVTKAEHQVFTNEWRRLIPYGSGAVGREAVEGAARSVYQSHPELLLALGL